MEQTISSVETVDVLMKGEKSLETDWSSSEESLKLQLVDTSEDIETKVDTSVDIETKVDTSVDIELENEVEGVVPKEETVAEVDTVSQTATSPESSSEDTKKEISAKSNIC